MLFMYGRLPDNIIANTDGNTNQGIMELKPLWYFKMHTVIIYYYFNMSNEQAKCGCAQTALHNSNVYCRTRIMN